MKRMSKKLTLKAESLYRLDSLTRAAAAIAYTPHCSVNYSCPITYCGCPPLSEPCPPLSATCTNYGG